MSWSDLKSHLYNDLQDATGDVAIRAASRVIPQIGGRLRATRSAKDYGSPEVLAILRGLITAYSAKDQYDAHIGRASDSAYDMIVSRSRNQADVARSVRGAIKAVLPTHPHTKLEDVRVALQAASDIMKNNFPTRAVGTGWFEELSRIDIWEEAKEDINLFKKEGSAPKYPPLSISYIDSKSWKDFSSRLLNFDASWEVWLLWLRFRLMGVASDRVPSFLWPKIERQVALMPEEIWSKSELAVNAEVGNTFLKIIEEYLDDESRKPQNPLGMRYTNDKNGKIDIDESGSQDNNVPILITVLEEVSSAVFDLISECSGNSDARLKYKAEQYMVNIDNNIWKDDVILVMRGDALRKELSFQKDREEDSDIPPLAQSVLKSLEQTVSVHNMLINMHPQLSKLDLMLLGPDERAELVTPKDLKEIVESANAREVFTQRVRDALQEVAEDAPAVPLPNDRRSLRASVSAKNLVHHVGAFIWTYKKTFGGALVGAPPAFYAVGKWALANENILLGYFANNPGARLLIQKAIEWLHTLPLL